MSEIEQPTPLTPPPDGLPESSGINWPVFAGMLFLPVFITVVALSLLAISNFSRTDEPSSGSAVETHANPIAVPVSMKKFTVANAEERQAVCNDGTPAVYYFSPGTTDHAEDWVIHLHGGGHCVDDASCTARAEVDPQYTSSENYRATFRKDGIFSTSAQDNPDFYNWNHVEVMYCSSDVWSGTADGLVNGEMWHFYGHNIITAVIEDLQNPDIIETSTLAEASRLIFTGSSAGGVGASINLDRVAGMLPQVEVKGLIDSAFTFPVDRYSNVNAQGEISTTWPTAFQGLKYDESCSAANPDPLVCASLLGMYPYLDTPVYVFTYQLDPVLMQNLAGMTNLKDPAQQNYIETVWTPTYMSAITQIDPVFSSDAVQHTAAMNDRFYDTKIGGISFAQAFGDWYFGRGTTTRYIE